MTWVVGNSGIFGYCLLMGDTMVTLKYPNNDKKYFDGLQKIYPVSNSFAAGFSGDVEIGLMYMNDLQNVLSGLPEGSGWIPDYFMYRHYDRRARHIYRNLPEGYNDRPLDLMIMGISPLATDTHGGGGMPRTHGYILKAPDFEIQKVDRNKFFSIGSGSMVGIYTDKLNRLNNSVYNELMQMEVGHPGRYGIAISDYIRSIVADNPLQEGISKHFVTALVHRGEVEIRIRTTRRVHQDGVLSEDDTPITYNKWSDLRNAMETRFGDISTAECRA